ncbi:MAG: S8 family serine peptidase [Candidatus Thorarchaeota archaeon]
MTEDNLLALDVAIPEVGADDVWDLLDSHSNPITGDGMLVACLDTGIDWRHPHLWFADGAEYDWIDSGEDGDFQNLTDGIDLDGNAVLADIERAYFIDIDEDGEFDASTEWIWVDNITQDGIPEDGEPFFVIEDSDSDDRLDSNEQLVMLKTPKTKYIVETDPNTGLNIVWERGVNLTSSTHHDRDGHGTATSGIVLGGQIGFREHVGVAPGADLMMIRIHGYDNESLDTINALETARSLGANVVLLEEGQWIERFLDGSSEVEQLINELVEGGIPVVVPAGNLGNEDKHCKFDVEVTADDNDHTVRFQVPTTLMTDSVWITFVTQSDIDFMDAEIQMITPAAVVTNLHPQYGYRNYGTDFNGLINVRYQSYVLNSSRGTKMLHINMQKPVELGGVPRSADPYRLEIGLPENATIHGYISENPQRWSGGVIWTSDVSDEYVLTHPATADAAIPVLSYHTRSLWDTAGAISGFSPLGPRIDGTSKYGIAAPGGYDIVSCYGEGSYWLSWYNGPSNDFPFTPRFGGYRLISGTSAAGGFVAGCAALMLQVMPDGGEIVDEVMGATARSDIYTGTVPNAKWGYGKLDALTSVNMMLNVIADTNHPTIGIPQTYPTFPEAGQTIRVNVTASDAVMVHELILSYSNSSGPFNVTMFWTGSCYEAEIPPQLPGTIIFYQIYASDLAGNTGLTEEYRLLIQDPLVTMVTIVAIVAIGVVAISAVLIRNRRKT